MPGSGRRSAAIRRRARSQPHCRPRRAALPSPPFPSAARTPAGWRAPAAADRPPARAPPGGSRARSLAPAPGRGDTRTHAPLPAVSPGDGRTDTGTGHRGRHGGPGCVTLPCSRRDPAGAGSAGPQGPGEEAVRPLTNGRRWLFSLKKLQTVQGRWRAGQHQAVSRCQGELAVRFHTLKPGLSFKSNANSLSP